MTNNIIEIYQNNSKTILATITTYLDSISGYTAVLTVKKDINDVEEVISSTGVTTGFVVQFDLSPSETNISPGLYYYDVVLTNENNNYTAIQSTLKILDSVKY